MSELKFILSATFKNLSLMSVRAAGGRFTSKPAESGSLMLSNLAPIKYHPIKRLILRSREVSKPWDWQFVLSHRFGIWQAPRQHCCRGACQISFIWQPSLLLTGFFMTLNRGSTIIGDSTYSMRPDFQIGFIYFSGYQLLVPALAARCQVQQMRDHAILYW